MFSQAYHQERNCQHFEYDPKEYLCVAGAPVIGPRDLTRLTITESRTAPSRGGQNSARRIRKVCSV